MSNLGGYQTMTTMAKSLGGPGVLGIAVAGGGYLVLRVVEGGAKALYKWIKKVKAVDKSKLKEYRVQNRGVDDQGLELREGDVVCVLERDGEAVLIEKVGSDNNPFFVSADFLRKALGSQFDEA